MATLAHELNNPLSVITGNALLMRESVPDANSAERLEKILQAADRSSRIIKSTLGLFRNDPVGGQCVDVEDIILKALESCGHTLRGSGIEVSLGLAENLPTMRGGADQLCQVFTNLINNAQQAMADWAGIRRLLITTDHCQHKRQIIVVFEDTGPGICKSIRSQIFDPFVTNKEIGVGTGIGLALCKRIVEAHAGSITLETNSENGATFVVRLPVECGAQHEDGPLPAFTRC